MAINNAPILDSEFSPYYLNYGFHPCLECDLFSLHAPQHDAEEEAPDFLYRIHSEWEAAQGLMVSLQDDIRFRENRHRHATALVPGDLVLVSLKKHETASLFPRGPLAPHLAGPFKVLKAVSDDAYQLDLTPEL